MKKTLTLFMALAMCLTMVLSCETAEPVNPDDKPDTEQPEDPGNTEEPEDPGNTEDPEDPGNTDDPENPGDTDDPVDPVVLGSLQYTGALTDPFNVIPAGGTSGIGYWYAQTKDTDATDWITREHRDAEFVQFYSGVVFTVIDDATGAAADWITVSYREADTWWDCTVQENTSPEQRSATVTATFSDALGYVLVPECATKTVKVVQAGAGAPKVVTYGSTSVPAKVNIPATAQEDSQIGYGRLTVDGTDDVNYATGLCSRVTFKCVSEEDAAAGNYDNEVDWLSCRYATGDNGIWDCIWCVTATANEGSTPRTAVIVLLFPEDEEYSFPEPMKVVVTQLAGQDNTIYDPTSSVNMWNSMTVEEMFCFYAPGWQKIFATEDSGSLQEGELFEAEGNWYKFKMAAATYERWQAQFAFRTNMSSSADKTYDFYCVLNSNKDVAAATVKLVQTGADGNFYFDQHPVQLVAGTDVVIKVPFMAGKDMDKISLFFDFGGNPENTEVIVKDIIFQEHQE